MMELVKALWNRMLSEPALVVALVLAVGNLAGSDWSGQANFIESALVLLGGVLVRQQVTPVRDLP